MFYHYIEITKYDTENEKDMWSVNGSFTKEEERDKFILYHVMNLLCSLLEEDLNFINNLYNVDRLIEEYFMYGYTIIINKETRDLERKCNYKFDTRKFKKYI